MWGRVYTPWSHPRVPPCPSHPAKPPCAQVDATPLVQALHPAAATTPHRTMRHPVIAQALELLACEVHQSDVLTDPSTVKDFLRLKLADRPHEVFAVVFLDAQHRVIDVQEMFRGTLTQTSVYPREVVIEALKHNAAALILCHNHPSGCADPSRADETLTQTLKQALALVDVRVLDHFIVTRAGVTSFAELGIL